MFSSKSRHFLPKDYIVMIDRRNFFDQPIKNDQITYNNILKIGTDQEDDYTTGCLLDFIIIFIWKNILS